MFNYWENAMPGQRLHLVWRQVRLSPYSKHVQGPNGAGPSSKGEGWQEISGDKDKLQYLSANGTKQQAISKEGYLALPDPSSRDYAGLSGHEKQAQRSPFDDTTWQLLPYSGTEADYTEEVIWWNPQIVPGRLMHRPITVGFVFQGIGAGERSDQTVAIRKATQLAEDRFKLPMIHCFVRV
jgi:hypothetical protein